MSTGGATSNYGGTLTLRANSTNCKGTLYGRDSTVTAYVDIVSKINTINTNLQAINTLLAATVSAEDAVELQNYFR